MSDGSIMASGLRKDFADLRAVDGVDLDIPTGRIFGFLGPNGAGKSTLVKMLATILAPTAGEARIAGFDLARDPGRVRATIGVALQDVGLDPLLTSTELLILQARLFGASFSEAAVLADELLRTVGLDYVDPKKRVGEFSGGMKRRLDLALALVNRPTILFLDEPTTGLDPSSRAAVWEEVRRLNREAGVTIFLTTQYLEEADRLAEEVAIIDQGRIVAQASPQALKRQVGEEVVTLDLADPETAERVDAALAGLDGERRVSGSQVMCYTADSATYIPQAVRRLDAAAIALVGIRVSEPTLDDVFLRVTGQHSRGEAAS
jgi:ABC-2 type transport system ATP-binding protein